MKEFLIMAEAGADSAWHCRPAETALLEFHSTAAGLTAGEAARRLSTDGPNTLTQGRRASRWQILSGQFKSFIIWILLVAGVISGVLGERVDAIAIFAIVMLNAIIGFYQEYHAEKSIVALQHLTAPKARVQRGGNPPGATEKLLYSANSTQWVVCSCGPPWELLRSCFCWG